MIKPIKRTHKEVIIEFRIPSRFCVAVLEEGRTRRSSTIERTNEERLVGSIFKGKVKNIEDAVPQGRLCGHRFREERLPPLLGHCAQQLSIVALEVVERQAPSAAINRASPRRKFPVSILRAATSSSRSPRAPSAPRVRASPLQFGPARTLPGPASQFRSERHFLRKIENQEERHRLKKILRELAIPEGMGVIIRTVGEGQLKRYFIRDLALLLDEWRQIQNRITTPTLGQPASSRSPTWWSVRCATSSPRMSNAS